MAVHVDHFGGTWETCVFTANVAGGENTPQRRGRGWRDQF